MQKTNYLLLNYEKNGTLRRQDTGFLNGKCISCVSPDAHNTQKSEEAFL